MIHWVKDCECENAGVKVGNPNLTAHDKDSLLTFGLVIDALHCSICGKPWKQVELKLEAEKKQR